MKNYKNLKRVLKQNMKLFLFILIKTFKKLKKCWLIMLIKNANKIVLKLGSATVIDGKGV